MIFLKKKSFLAKRLVLATTAVFGQAVFGHAVLAAMYLRASHQKGVFARWQHCWV
jgi:hypothetical protein